MLMKAVPMLLTALSLGAGAAIAGCTDPATTAPAARVVEAPIGASPARPAARTVHRVIGPAGGTLQIGPHTLTIPPGALSRHVNIRAKIGGKSVNVIELKPDRLVFEAPAVLTMSYANCDREGRTNALRIAVVNETLDIVDYVSSSDDDSTQTVTGNIPDFSNYAVAW